MTARGVVDKNQKGFAFIGFDDRKLEDAFVPPREAAALFHGDRVEVKLTSRGQVLEVEVLEHRFRELVGRYEPHPQGRGGWIIYERKRAREEVYLPHGGGKARPGDWVKTKLHFHEEGEFVVTGEVVEVYGKDLPASADIGMVASEFNLLEAHSRAAIEQAKAYGAELEESQFEGRRDLRGVPFITIDGETARDFDDAVYVERRKGGFTLWVAIADVSHYVKHGTALDTEARSRGTSVYFPEKAFHMLPRELSENLCSLKPKVPRLAMTAKIDYDYDGKPVKTEVMESVIFSRRRATYNEIQAEWEQNKKNKDWEYAPHFELYQLIRKQRSERGSIDFDLPEAEMKVAPDGEVISIKERARLDAHRLIEEFMIGANEAVTAWMMDRSWPFVYRVHEEPAMEALMRFQELADTVGVHFSVDAAAASPKILADLVRSLEGNPAQSMMNSALLRSLKQALYSATHGTHFGLASPGYTHFTSPIRRYPDLVVHRLIRRALAVEAHEEPMPKGKAREELEGELNDICEHCSYRERLAAEAERESIKLKQVRAMIKHLGEEFDGQVVGLIETGMFVKIPDPYVEGLVTRDAMTDDFYQFDEKRLQMVGKRTRNVYRIGDRVRVRCVLADIDRRMIDLALLND